MRIPKVIRIMSRSIAAGISAAGIVNTAVPGLFSTSLGYIAGSLRGTAFASVMVRMGLFTLGAFATPAISGLGILALGAIAGALAGLLCSIVYLAISLVRKRKHRHLPPHTDEPEFHFSSKNLPSSGRDRPFRT